jgi:hypothetical protein
LVVSISLLTKPEYEKVLKFARMYGNSKLEGAALKSLRAQNKESGIFPQNNEKLAPEYWPSKWLVVGLIAYSFACLSLFFFMWK